MEFDSPEEEDDGDGKLLLLLSFPASGTFLCPSMRVGKIPPLPPVPPKSCF
jgi:hypothetical protein